MKNIKSYQIFESDEAEKAIKKGLKESDKEEKKELKAKGFKKSDETTGEEDPYNESDNKFNANKKSFSKIATKDKKRKKKIKKDKDADYEDGVYKYKEPTQKELDSQLDTSEEELGLH